MERIFYERIDADSCPYTAFSTDALESIVEEHVVNAEETVNKIIDEFLRVAKKDKSDLIEITEDDDDLSEFVGIKFDATVEDARFARDLAVYMNDFIYELLEIE